ncbi:MAG: cyclic nucleotide-binding domain-containing protein [Myxococcota bacterium]|nr:cyclic nucleotide-binding domain-containing protein [Myxococcota bacterium]
MSLTDPKSLPLFRMVPKHHLDQALEQALTPFEVGAGEILTVEGESDSSLMIVVDGHLEILCGEPATVVATVGQGAIIGDMALFGVEGKRHATVRTAEACSLLVLDEGGLNLLRAHGNLLVPLLEQQVLRTLGKRLREMSERISEFAQGTELATYEPEGLWARLRSWLVPDDPHPQHPAPTSLQVLQNSPVFQVVEPHLLQAIADHTVVEAVPQGALLLREGQRGNDAFIVGQGRIDVYRATRNATNEKLAELGPGRLFGLVSLVHGAIRSASCYAAQPTWVLRLPGELLEAFEDPEHPAASAFRQVVYDALARQLVNANLHMAELIQALAQDPQISERERQAYANLVLHTA